MNMMFFLIVFWATGHGRAPAQIGPFMDITACRAAQDLIEADHMGWKTICIADRTPARKSGK